MSTPAEKAEAIREYFAAYQAQALAIDAVRSTARALSAVAPEMENDDERDAWLAGYDSRDTEVAALREELEKWESASITVDDRLAKSRDHGLHRVFDALDSAHPGWRSEQHSDIDSALIAIASLRIETIAAREALAAQFRELSEAQRYTLKLEREVRQLGDALATRGAEVAELRKERAAALALAKSECESNDTLRAALSAATSYAETEIETTRTALEHAREAHDTLRAQMSEDAITAHNERINLRVALQAEEKANEQLARERDALKAQPTLQPLDAERLHRMCHEQMIPRAFAHTLLATFGVEKQPTLQPLDRGAPATAAEVAP